MRVLALYLLILVFLSLNPWLHPDSGMAIGPLAWDKIDHAVAYGLLSLLLMTMLRLHKRRWLMSFTVLLTCSLLGVFLEYCQLWLTATRQFSYFDAGANAIGSLLGVVLFWCYLFIMPKRIN